MVSIQARLATYQFDQIDVHAGMEDGEFVIGKELSTGKELAHSSTAAYHGDLMNPLLNICVQDVSLEISGFSLLDFFEYLIGVYMRACTSTFALPIETIQRTKF